MTNDLIPFGKHKGKPIEILAADKEYTEWLLAQPWFKTKYQNIYTIVINNFHTPVDTPEHNEMQVKFLDTAYALKLAYHLEPNLFRWNSLQINKELIQKLSKPSKHATVVKNKIIERKYDNKLLNISSPTFETGYDVSFSVAYGIRISFDYEIPERDNTYHFELNNLRSMKLLIEIKPTIGDDFPAVLRQMKVSMPVKSAAYIPKETYNCLLIRDYIGTGASKEQFIQFFQSQNYDVVFLSDIENIRLPVIEEDFRLNLSCL